MQKKNIIILNIANIPLANLFQTINEVCHRFLHHQKIHKEPILSLDNITSFLEISNILQKKILSLSKTVA